MKHTPLFVGVLAGVIAVTLSSYGADWVHHPTPFAKSLAQSVVSSQMDVLDAIFHVTPPGTSQNYAVAAHTPSEQGSKSGEDDLSVIKTGNPLVEVQKDGKRIGVLVPLFDRDHQTVGAIGLMYVYPAGADKNVFLRRSKKIRDSLALKISSKASLFKTSSSCLGKQVIASSRLLALR